MDVEEYLAAAERQSQPPSNLLMVPELGALAEELAPRLSRTSGRSVRPHSKTRPTGYGYDRGGWEEESGGGGRRREKEGGQRPAMGSSSSSSYSSYSSCVPQRGKAGRISGRDEHRYNDPQSSEMTCGVRPPSQGRGSGGGDACYFTPPPQPSRYRRHRYHPYYDDDEEEEEEERWRGTRTTYRNYNYDGGREWEEHSFRDCKRRSEKEVGGELGNRSNSNSIRRATTRATSKNSLGREKTEDCRSRQGGFAGMFTKGGPPTSEMRRSSPRRKYNREVEEEEERMEETKNQKDGYGQGLVSGVGPSGFQFPSSKSPLSYLLEKGKARLSSPPLSEPLPMLISSTERVRYRNEVTNKLLDLVRQVSDMYDCQETMEKEVWNSMCVDPRYTTEKKIRAAAPAGTSSSSSTTTRGILRPGIVVNIASRPQQDQRVALRAVLTALSLLQNSCVELVSAYLTPEEKRYLGLNTHFFQTQRERMTQYQYVGNSSKIRKAKEKETKKNRSEEGHESSEGRGREEEDEEEVEDGRSTQRPRHDHETRGSSRSNEKVKRRHVSPHSSPQQEEDHKKRHKKVKKQGVDVFSPPLAVFKEKEYEKERRRGGHHDLSVPQALDATKNFLKQNSRGTELTKGEMTTEKRVGKKEKEKVPLPVKKEKKGEEEEEKKKDDDDKRIGKRQGLEGGGNSSSLLRLDESSRHNHSSNNGHSSTASRVVSTPTVGGAGAGGKGRSSRPPLQSNVGEDHSMESKENKAEESTREDELVERKENMNSSRTKKEDAEDGQRTSAMDKPSPVVSPPVASPLAFISPTPSFLAIPQAQRNSLLETSKGFQLGNGGGNINTMQATFQSSPSLTSLLLSSAHAREENSVKEAVEKGGGGERRKESFPLPSSRLSHSVSSPREVPIEKFPPSLPSPSSPAAVASGSSSDGVVPLSQVSGKRLVSAPPGKLLTKKIVSSPRNVVGGGGSQSHFGDPVSGRGNSAGSTPAAAPLPPTLKERSKGIASTPITPTSTPAVPSIGSHVTRGVSPGHSSARRGDGGGDGGEGGSSGRGGSPSTMKKQSVSGSSTSSLPTLYFSGVRAVSEGEGVNPPRAVRPIGKKVIASPPKFIVGRSASGSADATPLVPPVPTPSAAGAAAGIAAPPAAKPSRFISNKFKEFMVSDSDD